MGAFPLAQEFGWSFEYILWDLPLSMFHQAHSWLFWKKGIPMRYFYKSEEDRDDIARLLGI